MNDLIKAVDYLNSKKIAHQAVIPENIIVVESSQVEVEGCVLGGLHATKFVTSSEENKTSNALGEKKLKELEVNVISFGNVIKAFLDICPTLKKFSKVSYGIKKVFYACYASVSYGHLIRQL